MSSNVECSKIHFEIFNIFTPCYSFLTGVNSIFSASVISLSCIVFVLLVVIGVLIWRLRRAVPNNRATSVEEVIKDDMTGKPDLPRDQHVSVPGSSMELRPRPSEGQSFAPPEIKSSHGTNKDLGYYNVEFNKGNSGNEYETFEETYEEIQNVNPNGM